MDGGTFSAQTRTEKDSCWWRMTNVPRKVTVTTRAIFPPPPLRSDGLERGSSGKASRSRPRGRAGVDLLANTIDGARTANSLASWTDKDCHAPCAITLSPASALSALKKSLVASLSAKRQLSVAKLSAKRIFSLAKRDFLVANGRMAADFSSPVSDMSKLIF